MQKERARTSVWRPGLSRKLEEVVKKCPTCIKHHFNTAKQAIPSELSDGPLQKVAADLLGLKDQHYQLVIDYLSSYVN